MHVDQVIRIRTGHQNQAILVFSTIIIIEYIFTVSLLRHVCMSRFSSSFTFENTYSYLSRLLSWSACENTEGVV